MNRVTFIILLISCFSFIGFFIISAVIYKINQKKMDKIIDLYMEKGFCLSSGAYIGHFMGIHGQIHPAVFFYKLLTGKRIRINRPDSKYMPQESYDFIQNLPSSLTHWMKTCIITTYIGGALFFTATIIVLIQKHYSLY
ncbi:hypothetical protein EAE91_15750 [Photorhabdus noenieputensis]|uniref:hypothetical protein n=1 Tax=Photorhabdus noenieputensis TaxID=1208607 RepID=UPI001BD1D1EA|nr:hypothetical protein [Photorhabdus noenieputensis]MBS9438546.1 hypothetical protein [Photorhabdus noenieputensis]MCK3670194.1 hypothetical protein [Photorhabdus noenieputensis]